ncbi:uncharacterized protein LOC109541008 [Dendroctonus ponderosae]|uniref:uncharacterized protein LOC109541008 n=1 Tax=Dendroctonus ponderosae TaxID=77166 RepID=UPI002034B158|nr:uncharacterized protein LOC109541008 [Dendroctonus ponderosae]KAH1029796.1 hypothetical protein HUJ05_002964 [Dendroctonus ponderosae]
MSGTPSSVISHLHANFVKLVSSKFGRGANMKPGLSLGSFVLFWLFASVNSKAIQPSGKLDFEDASTEESLAKTEKTIPTKISVQTNSAGGPAHVIASVSCGSTGCNATSNNNSVETQILVHVQTKVHFDPSQRKKILENASDVPIVAGYRGGESDRPPFSDDDNFNRSPPGRFEQHYGSSRGDLTPPKHFYSDSSSTNYGLGGDSSQYPYQSSYRPASNGYREHSSTFASFDTNRPANGLNYFGSSTRRPLDSTGSNSNRPEYRENGVNLQIPYFEQSYNKHYFNEEPPPHTVWLRKGTSRNPVEFQNIPRSQWRPVYWNGRNNKYSFSDSSRNLEGSYRRNDPHPEYRQQEYRPRNDDPQCSCRDHRTERYDRSATVYSSHKRASGFIDDKLSSLN